MLSNYGKKTGEKFLWTAMSIKYNTFDGRNNAAASVYGQEVDFSTSHICNMETWNKYDVWYHF